jgi:serine/threonine protein kinase
VFSYWDQADPLFDVITHKWMHVAHTYDSRPYEEEDAARIFRGLVITLDKLHSADILHGNLAPDNILVDLNDIDKVYLPDLRWAEKCNDGEKVSKQRGHAGFGTRAAVGVALGNGSVR